MHGKIACERRFLSLSSGMYHKLGSRFFNRFDRGPDVQRNSEFLSATRQARNQVGIEAFEHSRSAMKDSHTRSSTDRYMGKFHCDVAASHKSNLGRKPLKLQELCAVD